MTTARITTRPLDRRRLLRSGGGAVAVGVVWSAPARIARHVTQTDSDAEGGPERLAALLAVLPEDVAGDLVFAWADLERQLDAAGLAAPDEPDDFGGAFIQVTQSLALSSNMFRYAARTEYEETFGLAPARITQSLTAGEPGSALTLVRGPFRERDLIRAWERSDYKPVETPDGTVWSWADGPEVDMSSLVSRFGVGALNNAAMLPDDTIVFAPTVDLVAATLAVAAGNAPSLAAREDIAPLLTTLPTTLVSAIVLHGSALTSEREVMTPEARQQIEELRAEQEDAVGPMPAVTTALFGITAGVHIPEGAEEMFPGVADDVPMPVVVGRLLTESDEDAAQAAKVVAYRWAEWPSLVAPRPLTTLLELESAEVDESAPVTNLEFAPAPESTGAAWNRLIYNGDLAAFGP